MGKESEVSPSIQGTRFSLKRKETLTPASTWTNLEGAVRSIWDFIIGHDFKERETEECRDSVTQPMRGEVGPPGFQAMPLTTEQAACVAPG